MPSKRISELRNSSILRVYAEKDIIKSDPEYQRMSEVWDLGKRQLLIDTILNDFDMPKLYFHELTEPKQPEDGRIVKYAVIDGRQRLEAIWGFIDGDFPLADDFEFVDRPSVNAGGMTYTDLGKNYPQLKTLIDSYTLPVTTVLTDDLDLIEEMFLRLNEAAPLNAAEKRNAMGGPMATIIRSVADHQFFKTKVPFSNRRYQHREVAAKFLLLTSSGTVGDTKKAYLDDMVRAFKQGDWDAEANDVRQKVEEVLDWADSKFVLRDILLRTQAMTVVYFLVLKEALAEGRQQTISRHKLIQFEDLRAKNRKEAANDIARADYDLLAFDRVHIQGSNDKSSIEFRVRILSEFLNSNPPNKGV